MAKIRAEKEFRILAELGRKIDDFVEAVEGERQCP